MTILTGALEKETLSLTTKKPTKKYFDKYDNSLNTVGENEVVKGRVTAIHSGDVVLDINYKSDGLVSFRISRYT